jgi:uncharacterized protein YceK
MNKFLILMTLLLSGCAQLMNGQEQPVSQYRDVNTYKTTCSGTAEDWGSCFRKAKRTCPNGYEVSERFNDSTGIIREMVFTCK